jgi:hypothetical protein
LVVSSVGGGVIVLKVEPVVLSDEELVELDAVCRHARPRFVTSAAFK